METKIYFEIIRKNRFGQYCYIETPNPNDQIIDHEKIWTIENPSVQCINLFPNYEIRTYGSNNYLMSRQASDKIQKPNRHDGEAIVIETEINGVEYYLMNTDNKPYVQNVQGGKIDEEYKDKEGKCAIREAMEELDLTIDPSLLIKVGKWGFTFKNELVGSYNSKATTTLFKAKVPYESVKHLVNRELDPTNFNIFDVKEYSFKLDETTHVIFVPKEKLETLPETLPETIANKSFGGHHVEVIRRMNGLVPREIKYLEFFEV